jgi:hypothetical protein
MVNPISKSQMFFDNLRNSQLIGITLEEIRLRAKLTFTLGTEYKDVIIEFYHIVHFTLAKEPNEDSEDCPFVGEVKLKIIEDGGMQILSDLHHQLFSKYGEVASYPSQRLYYFQIEGAMSINIVCGGYQIFQEIE